jgi:diguanylate cyclase (GGDEF)-like protein
MLRLDPPRLQQALDELQEAARDHEAWFGNLMRSIVCRVDAGPDDLDPAGHRHCRFGRWYHAEAQLVLRDQPSFAAIESEHVRLHQLAARVLSDAAAKARIPTTDYDELVACSLKLRLELETLRHEIETALHNRDALTGAFGRVEILPALRDAGELVRRDVQQACITFMDLDHFKEVNDAHGHLVGDAVLAGAVRYVTEHLRTYDKVFRYGGDEFLILLPAAHIEVASRLIERLRSGLAATALAVDEAGRPLRMTASFGITPLEPDVSAEECVDRADKALLLAKAAGRNRVLRWDPSVTTARLAAEVCLEDLDDRPVRAVRP